MTDTEAALQAAFEADPDDFLPLLVLADHLDEIGDARAAGYRMLGAVRRRPLAHPMGWWWAYLCRGDNPDWGVNGKSGLPAVWVETLTPEGQFLHAFCPTLRDALDAAARLWNALTDAQQKECLDEYGIAAGV